MNNKLRIIITGSTGMVGEGVLHVSLANAAVEKVLVINRKPCGVTHPKLAEIIHDNFYDLSPVENKLTGYDACFFCLGLSSVGMKKKEYNRVTYTLTMYVAETLARLNNEMTFCYISGAGTDANSWYNWARVKAEVESDLQKLSFKKAFALRPGFIKPIPRLVHVHSFYKYINWLYPLGRRLFANDFCTMEELGLCMIHIAQHGFDKRILEGNDIIRAGK